MEKRRNEGVVLVIIWAALAVALSFFAEVRGSQKAESGSVTEGINHQLSLATVGALHLGPVHAGALGQRGEPVTEANWRQHPQIRAIRDMVSSVDAGLKKGIFKTSERRFDYCEEGYDSRRRISTDAKGVVRRYETQGGTEDHLLTYQHYYDQSGRLRFVYISGGAANGTRIQHRIYFDETGKRIWEAHKLVEGPGYPGFSTFPDEELQMSEPGKAFTEASPCPELKPRSRRRSG